MTGRDRMVRHLLIGLAAACCVVVFGTGPAVASAFDLLVVAQADQANEPFWTQLRKWLGDLHPAAAHFPIALLLAALPAELIARVRKSQGLAVAGRYCLVLGAVSAVVTTLLGFFWSGFYLAIDEWNTFTQHRTAGVVTAAVSIWLLIICWISAKPNAKASRTVYLLSLCLAAVLVGLTGFLGGALVWGTDHLWPW